MDSRPLLPQTNNTGSESTYFGYVLSFFGITKAPRVSTVVIASFLSLGALFFVAATIATAIGPRQHNVIMLVSDGFGPASETLARNFYAHVNSLDADAQLPLDKLLVGSSRTRSSDSLVTDSAAGATAFSCAKKSYNGAIAVDANKQPCGTVLEAAKQHGYLTGLVVTSRITHATPASFSAHVPDRDMEDEIAVQQVGNYSLGRTLDLAFGGGKCHFLPNSTSGSCRPDNLDVLKYGIQNHGLNVIQTLDEFRNLDKNTRFPIFGLFTSDHMSYEIDRDDSKEPSLKDMALKALYLLNRAPHKSHKGFFLMIEGSRIDMAAHTNDPAAHVREILAYNEMIEAVKAWVDKNGPYTVMVSTSDHETGGLSVAHQLSNSYPVYAWYPEILEPVKNSSEALGAYLAAYPDPLTFSNMVVNTVIPEWLGISDASYMEIAFLTTYGKSANAYAEFTSKMVSNRAGLGWATHGHSAVDVNLYAHGYKAEELRGNHENTEIGKFLESVLGVDLSTVTKQLLKKSASAWWNRIINSPRNHKQASFGLLHYHTNAGQ